jgi:transcriptional regulator of acetoin/glycerol metabolism
MEYDWPGNIRELENVIEHCFVLCNNETINTECLPKRLRDMNNKINAINITGPVKNIKEIEKNLIISTLEKNKWNRKKTAQELNIDPSTLWRKMKKYGIIDK